jgi:hypothetical protein
MTDPPPTPADVPSELATALSSCSPAQLRDIAGYAAALAEYRERTEATSDEDERTEEATDRPAGVPAKATITTKEINDNRYHYWQWREGDSVRSKYKGPADGDG